MKIFPAIDIKDKKVVRLVQGDFDKMTVYSENPCEIAMGFKTQGASNLHLVDLDGAKDGKLANFKTITEIVRKVNMFVEVGGGIRDEEKISLYLEAGVGRVILGTIAIENPIFVKDMVKKFGDKIAVGVDAKDGFVATHGWTTVSKILALEFCKQLKDMGVATVIFTDISKDGLLAGTNLLAYERLAKLDGLDIVASGGITSLSEISQLKEMGIYGAILGKALYANAIDLSEAVKFER